MPPGSTEAAAGRAAGLAGPPPWAQVHCAQCTARAKKQSETLGASALARVCIGRAGDGGRRTPAKLHRRTAVHACGRPALARGPVAAALHRHRVRRLIRRVPAPTPPLLPRRWLWRQGLRGGLGGLHDVTDVHAVLGGGCLRTPSVAAQEGITLSRPACSCRAPILGNPSKCVGGLVGACLRSRCCWQARASVGSKLVYSQSPLVPF